MVSLLKLLAVAGAEARWADDAMASSALAYRSALIAQMKRLWGCFLARENARLKIARLFRARERREQPHTRGARTEPRPARAQRRKLLPLPPARRPQQPELVARRLDQGRFLVVACSMRPRRPPTPRLRNCVSNPTSAKHRLINKRRSVAGRFLGRHLSVLLAEFAYQFRLPQRS